MLRNNIVSLSLPVDVLNLSVFHWNWPYYWEPREEWPYNPTFFGFFCSNCKYGAALLTSYGSMSYKF